MPDCSREGLQVAAILDDPATKRRLLTGPMREQCIALPNGRTVAIRESGNLRGRPVVYLHGFLGSRLECAPADALATELGLRLVSVDRPGFGLTSSAPPDPRIDAEDVAAITQRLGLHQAIVVGVSGASAAALLSAAHPAVAAPVTVLACPLGPLEDPRIAVQFSRIVRMALGISRMAPRATASVLEGLFRRLAQTQPERLLQLLCLRFAAADHEALRCPHWQRAVVNSLSESFRLGAAGALRDLLSYSQTWPRELWQITTPVLIWHGERDTVVPLPCAQALTERLANARLTIYEHEGHFSVPLRHMRSLLTSALKVADTAEPTRVSGVEPPPLFKPLPCAPA